MRISPEHVCGYLFVVSTPVFTFLLCLRNEIIINVALRAFFCKTIASIWGNLLQEGCYTFRKITRLNFYGSLFEVNLNPRTLYQVTSSSLFEFVVNVFQVSLTGQENGGE